MSLMGKNDLVKVVIFSWRRDAKIVDIGCDIALMFGARATNVDNRSIAEIKELFAKGSSEELVIPNFVQADAADLPFKNLEFDWAVLSEILEHVDDPVKVLDEAQRVARFVILTVPNEYQWASDKKPFQHPSHQRCYDEGTLAGDISRSGFIIMEFIKMSYAGWSFFVVWGESKYA